MSNGAGPENVLIITGPYDEAQLIRETRERMGHIRQDPEAAEPVQWLGKRLADRLREELSDVDSVVIGRVLFDTASKVHGTLHAGVPASVMLNILADAALRLLGDYPDGGPS